VASVPLASSATKRLDEKAAPAASRACELPREGRSPVRALFPAPARCYRAAPEHRPMDGTAEDLNQAIDSLADRYRAECLWFLREDYYPRTTLERMRVLEYIERHGDREAWRAAAELRQWLSPPSSETSSAS
jgi:hypothetical protein